MVHNKKSPSKAGEGGKIAKKLLFVWVLLIALSLLQYRYFNLEADEHQYENSYCKTLWFAGLAVTKFSNCSDDKFSLYESLYGSAIDSAMPKSNRTLQPVLVLHQTLSTGEGDANSNTNLPMIGKFAASRGAIVISIDSISFQEELDKHYRLDGGNPHRVGPFVRMDIPAIIEKHKLFSPPGICKKHVLYTDTDVLFPNEIKRNDINKIKKSLGNKIISYGPESKKIDGATNTGVMLMDVPRFEIELLPDLLGFLRAKGAQPAYDQGWIMAYYREKWEHRKTRKILSWRWNWKVYWRSPRNWNKIKIIHLHGPKPGRALEDIINNRKSSIPQYQYLVTKAQKYDKGRAAKRALDMFHATQASMNSFLSEQCYSNS